jgi:hypothetical protein
MAALEHISELVKDLPDAPESQIHAVRAAVHAAAVQAVRLLSAITEVPSDRMCTTPANDSDGDQAGLLLYRCMGATSAFFVHTNTTGSIVVEAAAALQPHSMIHFDPEKLFHAGRGFSSVECFTGALHTLTSFVHRQIAEHVRQDCELRKTEAMKIAGPSFMSMGAGCICQDGKWLLPNGLKVYSHV